MRLLVCEYVTGGGFAGRKLPDGLRAEGELMLRSLVRDLAASGMAELLVSRDAGLPAPDLPGELVAVAGEDDCWQVWADAISRVDAVWPIAPETGGALLRLSELVAASGKVLLGSRPEAVRLCGSKLATAARLAGCGIPVVPTRRLAVADLPSADAGWVIKPDDGAGAEDTFLVDDPGAWAAPGDWIVQPYLRGDASSLSLLCRDGDAALLTCNTQHIALDPHTLSSCPDLIRASTTSRRHSEGARRFRYKGWTVGGMEARRALYEPLARAIARAIPGLWGYVGVDLIETGSGPVILETNPRLTTTYAGLRDAIGANPAAFVLALASRGPMPAVGSVRPQHV